MTGAVSWIITWIAFIGLLVILAKFQWGKTLVYYTLWLAVLLLVLSHADELSSLIDTNALQLNG